jgi:hypothetical protein
MMAHICHPVATAQFLINVGTRCTTGCMSAESMLQLLQLVPNLTDLGGGQLLLQSHGPGEFLGEENEGS